MILKNIILSLILITSIITNTKALDGEENLNPPEYKDLLIVEEIIHKGFVDKYDINTKDLTMTNNQIKSSGYYYYLHETTTDLKYKSGWVTDTSYTFKNLPEGNYLMVAYLKDHTDKVLSYRINKQLIAEEIIHKGFIDKYDINTKDLTMTNNQIKSSAYYYYLHETTTNLKYKSGWVTDTSYTFKNLPEGNYLMVTYLEDHTDKVLSYRINKQLIAEEIIHKGFIDKYDINTKDLTMTNNQIKSSAYYYYLHETTTDLKYKSGWVTDTFYTFKNLPEGKYLMVTYLKDHTDKVLSYRKIKILATEAIKKVITKSNVVSLIKKYDTEDLTLDFVLTNYDSDIDSLVIELSNETTTKTFEITKDNYTITDDVMKFNVSVAGLKTLILSNDFKTTFWFEDSEGVKSNEVSYNIEVRNKIEEAILDLSPTLDTDIIMNKEKIIEIVLSQSYSDDLIEVTEGIKESETGDVFSIATETLIDNGKSIKLTSNTTVDNLKEVLTIKITRTTLEGTKLIKSYTTNIEYITSNESEELVVKKVQVETASLYDRASRYELIINSNTTNLSIEDFSIITDKSCKNTVIDSCFVVKYKEGTNIVFSIAALKGTVNYEVKYTVDSVEKPLTDAKGSISFIEYIPEVDYTAEIAATPWKERVNASAAYDQGYTGEGVTIAILDSGFEYNNPEFFGRVDANIGGDVDSNKKIGELRDNIEYGFIGGINTNPVVDQADKTNNTDVVDHGTHVAGIIAANKDGVGTSGMAYNAKLGLYNVLTRDGGMEVMKGIAKLNADQETTDIAVANMSIYMSGLNSGYSSYTTYVDSMYKVLENNTTIVLAAGNEGGDCKTWDTCNGFAQMILENNDKYNNEIYGGSVIVVGSVDGNNNLSSFSNKAGLLKDNYLVAPGEGINSVLTRDVGYGEMSGTSMAAPIVTGAYGLMREKHPNLKGKEITQILFDSATDLGEVGVDDVYGHGLLNLEKAFNPIGEVQSVTLSSTGIIREGRAINTNEEFKATSNILQPSLSSITIPVIDEYGRLFNKKVN